MDRLELYNALAERKSKPKDFEPYSGDNGRVNKALALYKNGTLKTGGIHVDVGGGIGDLGYALRKEGLFEKTLVIDIAAKNLEAARKKGNHVVLADIDKHGFNFDGSASLVDLQWTNDSFLLNVTVDSISALDFIEHIIDPESFARHCYNALKNGGEVFINTPNIQYWEHIKQLVQDGRFPHTSGDKEVYHGGHLAFFTYLDLCEIFGKAGFTDFAQIKDEEGYRQPPEYWLNATGRVRSQPLYVETCMRLGNPNLLFKAVKK